MKYHEKINLKSPIYKYSNNHTSRTPTKSPLKPSVNPGELFQKVCCPNCKYAFKIIKQQIYKENPIEIMSPLSKKTKPKQKKSIQVQTQIQPFISIHNSPNKTFKTHFRPSRSPQIHSHQEIQSHKMNKLTQILNSQNRDNRKIREPQFKFKPLSVSPNNKFMKSKNLLNTLDPKILSSDTFKIQEQFSHRNDFQQSQIKTYSNQLSLNEQMYEEEKVQQNYLYSPRKQTEKFQSNQKRNIYQQNVPQQQIQPQRNTINRTRSYTEIQKKDSKRQIKLLNQQQNRLQQADKLCCRCKNNKQFEELILRTFIKSDQNQKVSRQLKQLCKDAAEEIQMPSYCKMLLVTQ